MQRILRELRQPLCRYGFTLLAILAAANHLWPAAITTGAIATLAWKARP